LAKSLEPAVDFHNRITFLLDWELTMKCNLDCDYCPTGLHGGHDNSTQHPPLDQCLKSLDFMYKYADLYMANRPRGLKYVILNVYGGESLHHPNIVEILQQVRQQYQPYQDRWHLTVTMTTNAIATPKKLAQVIPLIDEFTASYHTNNTDRQKQQFRDNLLDIQSAGRRSKCIVLMHAEPDLFEDAQTQIAWCEQHNIKYLARQIDHVAKLPHPDYQKNAVQWFKSLYQSRANLEAKNLPEFKYKQDGSANLAEIGRTCCGGRQLCVDQNYRQREAYVTNQFPDWYCSVNHFFLFVKQLTGAVYVNKDCKMNFEGSVGPIGSIDHADLLLQQTQARLTDPNSAVIQCKKSRCLCGLCAPKAQDLDTYNVIMKKYQKAPQ
jgi:hypothetical protein